MALCDWNNDGKKDFVDNYIEYNVYKESTNNCDSDKSQIGFFGKLFIVFVVFYVFIYIFGPLFEPKSQCMQIGCLEDCDGSSIYCAEHRRVNE